MRKQEPTQEHHKHLRRQQLRWLQGKRVASRHTQLLMVLSRKANNSCSIYTNPQTDICQTIWDRHGVNHAAPGVQVSVDCLSRTHSPKRSQPLTTVLIQYQLKQLRHWCIKKLFVTIMCPSFTTCNAWRTSLLRSQGRALGAGNTTGDTI